MSGGLLTTAIIKKLEEAIKKEDFKGKSSKKKSVTFVTPASRLGR